MRYLALMLRLTTVVLLVPAALLAGCGSAGGDSPRLDVSAASSLASALDRAAPRFSGATVRLALPYTVTAEVLAQITNSATFLFSIKSINTDKLRPEAVMPEFTQAILKERGLSTPIGKVTAMNDSEFKQK